MIAHPNDLETALDIVWAAYKDETERWEQIFPNNPGTTRVRVTEITGWSYSTVHRLTAILVERGQLAVKWNHQHQSYWEGHFRPSDGRIS